MGKVYNNPPLVEALCEFRFEKSSPWDVTLFGHYYDRIKDEFPERGQQFQVQMSVGQPEGGTSSGSHEAEVRMRFGRPDGAALVQLSPHRLIVNKLPPYQSWEVFKTLILARLEDYRQVAESATLERVGLRYINRFTFTADDFHVGDVFAASDFLPSSLREAVPPFFMRLEMPRSPSERLFLTMGTTEAKEPDVATVLLDLDYVIELSGAEDNSLSTMLTDAHDYIEEVFESFLTNDLRKRFDEEE